jgi:SAM-dependent methyltransferase
VTELTEHARRNRAQWDAWAADYEAAAQRNWATDAIDWGIWHLPEAEVGALGDLDAWAGREVVELGCGTAYFGAWLARRGAHVTGIDNSPRQLETARRMQAEHGIEFPLLLGTAEALPFDDASFDAAISEYGASIWCDPYRWIPEAARVLRPGGQLVFLVNSPLAMMCFDEPGLQITRTLTRPQFGMHRFEWPNDDGDDSVEFHLPHGRMIDLLGECGFAVERLIELQVPRGATTTYEFADPEWSHRWPNEEIWVARKRS